MRVSVTRQQPLSNIFVVKQALTYQCIVNRVYFSREAFAVLFETMKFTKLSSTKAYPLYDSLLLLEVYLCVIGKAQSC